jgi:hypothetical protein
MGYTNTTSNSGVVLKRWEQKIIGAVERDMPEVRLFPAQGEQKLKTVIYNVVHAPAKQTAFRSEGTLLTANDAGEIASHPIELSRVAQSGPFGFSKEMDLETFMSKDIERKVLSHHMQRSLGYQFRKTMVNGGMWFRADNDRTYQIDARPDAGGSTTVTSDADALNGSANDAFIGGTITSQSMLGKAFGSSAQITDSVQSGGALTHGALPEAIDATGAYHVCHPYGLSNANAADLISVDIIVDMIELMREQFHGDVFPGGMFKCILSSGQYGDLIRDDTWQNTAIYSEPGRFGKYQVGAAYGCEFLSISDPDVDYRMTTGGVASATGAIHPAIFLGAESFAIHFWSEDKNKGPKINGNSWMAGFEVVDSPDSQNLDGRMNWLTWTADYAQGVKMGVHVLVLLTAISASPASYVIPY